MVVTAFFGGEGTAQLLRHWERLDKVYHSKVEDEPNFTIPPEEDDGIITLGDTEKSLKVFDFEENIIRTVIDDDGETLFLAKDVCDVLGYANSRKAVSDHCKEKGVTKRDTLSKGGKQQATFINEPNLMRLIVKSKLPAAEKFEAWVFEEVLPTIRKTGKYESPKVEPKPRKIDHLSPEVISVLKQARTVQLAMGMGKQQASRYARELVFDRFGIDMELATTGSRNVQLSIVK